MDAELWENNVDICAVQETRMAWEVTSTKNFDWFCSPTVSSTSHRGTGIMVNKHSNASLRYFRKYSEDVCTARVQKGKIGFIVIVVHVSSDGRKTDTFAQISSIISKIPPEDEFIIIGDFNGHIGTDDIRDEQQSLIGKQLSHKTCNENGLFMLQLVTQFDLSIRNTFARSKSVLQTWSNHKTSSQIDHVLQPKHSNIRIKEKHIKAEWPKLFNSDHKILTITIRAPSYYKPSRPMPSTTQQTNSWNVKLLSSEKHKKNYKDCINRRLKEGDPSPNWQILRTVLADAANEAIPRNRKIPRSPKTKKAYSTLMKKRFKQWKFPDIDLYRKEMFAARRDFEQAKKESVWRSWKMFFTDIHQVEPHLRVRKTYEFLKEHKRIAARKGSGKIISQHKWLENLLDSVVENQTLKLLAEDSVIPPPTLSEIKDIVYNLRNGTCPGLDGINAELLKNAPHEFFVELEELIKQIWTDNKAPEEITETIQIPIPKKTVPKDTTDYRKITLCNIVYKIIATYTLNKLDESM
ncbi:uncharacterized protein LOC109401612 [Aedes albopictus]|uniref:Endonuclease/exonuclease/phosphatase domain-containing protein n=1 Tax=Aedes albopictus TaxID=7160 RepID=A0ABM2A375_AEDAL|nr:uncharacterized protein LOC109401612 [Aedes albopictus]